jgi:Cu+-exporting ATPase
MYQSYSEKYLEKYGYHLMQEDRGFDVVCGMEVVHKSSVSFYKGKTYYFCSESCKTHFEANPEMYVGSKD